MDPHSLDVIKLEMHSAQSAGSQMIEQQEKAQKRNQEIDQALAGAIAIGL